MAGSLYIVRTLLDRRLSLSEVSRNDQSPLYKYDQSEKEMNNTSMPTSMDSNQRVTRNTVTTTRTTPAEGQRSASQILANALRANKNSDKKPSSSRGAARFGNRGASHDDVIQDNGLSSAASSIKTEKRASYNDGIPISSNAATSRRPSETRRALFSSEISEPSEKEHERFRAAAGKYAQSAARSTGRRLSSQKARRRTSYDDALACAWEPFVKASARNGTRRASYNDALSDSDDDDYVGCKYAQSVSRRRTSYDDALASGELVVRVSARNGRRRASYNDALSDSDDDDEAGCRYAQSVSRRRTSYEDALASGEPVVRVSARNGRRRASYNDALIDSDDDDEVGCRYAQSISRSTRRLVSSEKVGRRTSYDNGLASSREPVVNKASTRNGSRRAASYSDALSDSDGDDNEYRYRDSCNNRPLPRRRVSFSRNIVESVREIPTISKQEKRDMFYRKKDIKQFRMDLQLERALVFADLRKAPAPHLRRRSSDRSSIKGKEENVSGQKMIASRPDETQQANKQVHIPANTNNQIQQESTARDNYCRREVATASLEEPVRAFLSDSFITGSEVSAAATAADAVTSSPGVKKKP